MIGWRQFCGHDQIGRMNADEVEVASAISCEDSSHTPRRQSRAPAASMRTRTPPALEGQEPTLSDVASRDSKTHSPRQYRAGGTLVHFGAVVADAPSPLSTPRSATGQAQLRLGKPLRMKCRASPVLLFMRAGKVVAGTVGIVRATVPFHGEHDAQEPTKEG